MAKNESPVTVVVLMVRQTIIIMSAAKPGTVFGNYPSKYRHFPLHLWKLTTAETHAEQSIFTVVLKDNRLPKKVVRKRLEMSCCQVNETVFSHLISRCRKLHSSCTTG